MADSTLRPSKPDPNGPLPPLTISIRHESITSPTAEDLVHRLDAEIELLYPDWRDFPFVGEGDWLNENPAEMAEAERDGRLFYFVAWDVLAGRAVGCVGVRVLPWFPLHRALDGERVVVGDGVKTAELKRMFVAPECRGRRVVRVQTSDAATGSGVGGDAAISVETSVSTLLLQQAERFAREVMGVERMVLETGARQVAAMALYRRAGWTRRADFGDYAGAGEEVGGLSRCWEKVL